MDIHDPMEGSHQPRPDTVLDPVCGMHVDPLKARATAEHQGQTYYFCSEGCARRFSTEPEKYLARFAQPASSLVQPGGIAEAKPGACPSCGMSLEAHSVEYTCPMHPEIVRNGPGSCPICGMALEPRVASGMAAEDDSELRSMSRRFWVGVALSIPLLAISMGGMISKNPLMRLPMGWVEWIQFALATPVVLWGGWPFFVRGARSLVRRLNMFTLIGLGTGVAYVYSVVAVLKPGIFPPEFLAHGRPEVYFEVSAFIVTLVLMG